MCYLNLFLSDKNDKKNPEHGNFTPLETLKL